MSSHRFSISIHNIATASYQSLDLRGIHFPVWTISHVLRGNVETETMGVRQTAESGDLMLHPPHLPFDEQAASAGTHQWLAGDFQLGDTPHRDLLSIYTLPLIIRLGDHRDTYTETFERLRLLCDHVDSDNPFGELNRIAESVKLIGLILDSWRAMGSPLRESSLCLPDDRFADLIAYMHDHFAERLSRDDLARRVYLHPGYLDRAFRATHGIAPMTLLRQIRVNRARRLLETTDETLDGIATMCGFTDGAHLSRTFRVQTGSAPGAHRMGAKRTREGYIPPL